MDNKFSPYKEYKSTNISWLPKTPSHWKLLPGKACFTEKKTPNKGMLVTKVLSLSYGQLVVKPEEKLHGLVPESFETYQIVEPGDIIFRTTDLQNDWNSLRFGISRHKGIITSAYMCLRSKPILIDDYGHQILHAYDLMKIFYGLGSGLRQNIDWWDIKYLPVPVPPLEEQNAIVRFLDYTDRRIKRYIRAKQKLIKLLEEEKQAIIHQAVTRGLNPDVPMKPSEVDWLGDIPEHWEVTRLKNICRMKSGENITGESIESTGNYPVYGGNGLRGYTSEFTHMGSHILIGRQGALCGNVHLVDGEFWASEHAIVVAIKNKNDLVWLKYLLREMNLNQYSIAAAQPGLSVDKILNLWIPLPDKYEQEEISRYITEKVDRLLRLRKRYEKEISLLQEYRTRLIADVVTGKLDVREAAAQLPEELEDIEDIEEADVEDEEELQEEVDP